LVQVIGSKVKTVRRLLLIRILFVSPLIDSGKPTGGIANWTRRIFLSDYSKIHELSIVNTATIGKRAKQLYKKSFLEELKRTYRIICDLKRKMIAFKPDVVHINSACSATGLIRDFVCEKIASKSRVIVHFRCDIAYQVQSKISKFFLRLLVKNADKILTLNESSKLYLENNFNRNSDIIPNFIPGRIFAIANRSRIISDVINNVAYSGHITKQKGCDIIYEVAKLNKDIVFKLFGHLSQEFDVIERPNNIHLMGEVDFETLANELASADLFLFPTKTEGFPNALLEAMAFGLPVITSSVGAIPDMLEDKGGVVLKDVNVDSVDEALKSLTEDKETREKMSKWNIEKVTRCYSEETVLDRLFDTYQRLVIE